MTTPLIIVSGSFVLLLTLEWLLPLRTRTHPRTQRYVTNAVLSLLVWATSTLTIRPGALISMEWGTFHQFGLLHFLDVSAGVKTLLSFLLLDATFYMWHRMNHRLSFLWRFHIVHHIDPDLDVTTGFRFHFGEIALSALFRFAQILVLGISYNDFIVYELTFQIATYFHHSNIRLPNGTDRVFSYFIVTPKFHELHHSQIQTETDSNYSVLFSFWDRIFRTFSPQRSSEQVNIGIVGYTDKTSNKWTTLLAVPFHKQSHGIKE